MKALKINIPQSKLLERKVKWSFKFILITPPDNAQVLCLRLCFYVDKEESGGCEVEKEIELRDGIKNITYTLAIKPLYELEFRHRISTSRIVMNIMKSVNVTKTDVCIFIFLFTTDWILPCIHLPTFLFKKQNNSTTHIAVFVPSTTSSIFLFSYRPLSCIFCLQIYSFNSLFCDISLCLKTTCLFLPVSKLYIRGISLYVSGPWFFCCSISYLWDLSMLLYIAIVHLFLLFYNILFIQQYIYLFFVDGYLGCF